MCLREKAVEKTPMLGRFTILPVFRLGNSISFNTLDRNGFMVEQVVKLFLAFLISFMLVAVLTDSGRNLICYFKTWDEDECFEK